MDKSLVKERLSKILAVYEDAKKRQKENPVIPINNRRPLTNPTYRVPIDHPPVYRYIMMSLGFTEQEIERIDFRDEDYPDSMEDDFIEKYGMGAAFNTEKMIKMIISDPDFL